MKRKAVMIIEHAVDRYVATFPDYPSMGKVEANDASTLLRTGAQALQEEIDRRGRFGAGMKPPSTLGAHVFSNPDLGGKLFTTVEANFPG